MVRMSLAELYGRELVAVARKSIAEGWYSGKALVLDLSEYPAELQALHATFVTLQKHSGLRGCIGGLEPVRPLVQDVANNAYAAAFQDPRFPPLEAAEFNAVKIHISLLTLPQALVFSSEQNALTQLRPGIDGVILQEGERRATFLPSVWKSLISPERFLSSLKEKAGFSADYWSETLRLFRYGCEEIDENDL